MDTKALCAGYQGETYETMRDDKCRTEAYRAALAHTAAGRIVLDIGTGALALLAIMAAESGATRVYAVETNLDAAARARQEVEARGFADVITIVEGYSTEIELPERVELIVHEIFGACATALRGECSAACAGEIMSAEGAGHVLQDAFERHACAGAVSVPSSARTYIAAAEFPGPDYWTQLDHPMLVDPRATSVKLWNFPKEQVISPFVVLEELFFKPGELPLSELPISRTSEWAGFVMYITVPPLAKQPFTATKSQFRYRGSGAAGANQFLDKYRWALGQVELKTGDTVLLCAEVDVRTSVPQYQIHGAAVRGKLSQLQGSAGALPALDGCEQLLGWTQTAIP